MLFSPGLRKLALTGHVSSSVGWLGAVAAFLSLAVVGLTSADAEAVTAAYVAMRITAGFVIVPLSLIALITGILQALGTRWGLFRHYWIVAKLLITTIATAVLLLHLRPINLLAAQAGERGLIGGDLHELRIQLVANAGAALLALLAATALAVYKPRGTTPYGARRQHGQRDLVGAAGPRRTANERTPAWVRVGGLLLGIVVLLFLALHAAGMGLGGH